ncbi:MAG TPA: alanine--glyoxylate aminotransferase family protein [Longimicrobiales bacterium]|nr:alanine--glyoxylate aminotransferase family protein [Longimicrobiales bacterium]
MTGRFFLPGPTEVRPAVLAAMTKPMIGHRVAEMEELMASIQPRLRMIFRTERPVYVSASSATGLMEGAVRNGARRRVLSLVNGAFSERFFQIAKATGLSADSLEVPWGEGHTPDMLADALRGKDYDAVTVVHSETSTGALNPIADLAAVAHAAGDVVLLVDSVSGLCGADVRTDEWALDFILTGSQKAFALPPGLAFGVAQPHILERAASRTDRGIYFDFLEFEKNIQKNQTPNTPAVSLLFALAEQVAYIEAEGLEDRLDRHRRMAERTWAWCEERGLRILAPPGFRSPTVTTIHCPDGWTGPSLAAAVKARGFQIATGYGMMKDETFRIGHMGDHAPAALDELLDVLGGVLDS